MVLRRATSRPRWSRLLRRNIMDKSIITPHASQPRNVIATFKCTQQDPIFQDGPQCLIPPTALSTGRRWNTPRDAAANWCQRFELRVWPRQRLLAKTCRRTITPSSSIAPRMLRILIASDFLPSKTKSESKEMRNDSLFFHATVSYHPRNWCPPYLAHRSSAPLLALALAPLPLAQQFYASDHVSPCHR
jgi:hypothetical protein